LRVAVKFSAVPMLKNITLIFLVESIGKNHHPFAGIRAALAFVSRSPGKEWTGIPYAIGRARKRIVPAYSIPVIARLGRVLPESVRADAKKRLVHVFPKKTANGRIKDVHALRFRNQPVRHDS